METTRQQKISRLIQKELGDIFLLQTKATTGIIISITEVRITPDLSIAKVYLSVFPNNKRDELIEAITANTREIRFDLGKRLRHSLRIIPNLKFFIDESLDYADRIETLLK